MFVTYNVSIVNNRQTQKNIIDDSVSTSLSRKYELRVRLLRYFYRFSFHSFTSKEYFFDSEIDFLTNWFLSFRCHWNRQKPKLFVNKYFYREEFSWLTTFQKGKIEVCLPTKVVDVNLECGLPWNKTSKKQTKKYKEKHLLIQVLKYIY